MDEPNDEGLVPLVVRRVPLDEAGRPKHHMYNSDALWLTNLNMQSKRNASEFTRR